MSGAVYMVAHPQSESLLSNDEIAGGGWCDADRPDAALKFWDESKAEALAAKYSEALVLCGHEPAEVVEFPL